MGYRFALEGSGPYERVLLFGRIAATNELPEPFVSTIHDFTLMIPPAWEVERGTAPTEPDRFYGPRDLRFTVTMRRESAEVDTVAWAAGHFDRRSSGPGQYCRGQSGMRPVKDHQFRRWTVDGHPAALRSSCGYVDAAVAAGKRIYELSLMSPHVGPGGDDAAFALLSPRIDVGTPGGSGPVWTQTFRSRLHGYVLHYPQDWSASPASTVRAKDVFHASRSSSRLSITVRSKPRGQGLELFAERLLPHHVKGDGCHWNSTGIIWIPASRERFEPLKIAGHDAVVRSECDFIEAVIDLDDRALVLVFHSAERIPGAERTLFDLFTGAFEVTERS